MKWLALFLLNILVLVLAPVMVICALPFAYREPKNIFPYWLQWLNTPDDPGCNQGVYEPQVVASLRFGWYFKTWYWLGIRNQCCGLFASLCGKYDGSPVVESSWWKLKIYSVPGYKEITWPGLRVSLGYKVHTLKTAKVGDPIWWVFMPSFWKSREY
jgi:hypothetical protein